MLVSMSPFRQTVDNMRLNHLIFPAAPLDRFLGFLVHSPSRPAANSP
jgi:hypothetical protein